MGSQFIAGNPSPLPASISSGVPDSKLVALVHLGGEGYRRVLDPCLFLNICDCKPLGVMWPDSSSQVCHLPSLQVNSLNTFLLFFERSDMCPANLCEMKSFLFSQSVWDTKKTNFLPDFVFEMKDFHPLHNLRWQYTCWFFPGVSWFQSKKVNHCISHFLRSKEHKMIASLFYSLYWRVSVQRGTPLCKTTWHISVTVPCI